MTTLTFALSATFPGQTEGQPWDANWTGFPTAIAWSNTVNSEVNGAPLGPISSSASEVNGDTIDVPADATSGQFDLDNLVTIDGASYAYVTVDSFLVNPISSPVFTEQWITLNSVWNSIKDIEVSTISSQVLDVTGIVDTWINAPTDDNDHTISIDEAKRGAVALGNGNDMVQIDVAANEYTWSSDFDVTVGDGNDTVYVQPEAYAMLATLSAPVGWSFNSKPQLTVANITVGNGNDTVGLDEVSGTIHVGSGTDTIYIDDGDSTLWLGAGSDTVTIGSLDVAGPAPWAYDTQVGTSTVHVGSGYANISIDDTIAARTPQTTLDFIHGETGGSTLATADQVRFGHFGSGGFVGGDLSALTIDLAGYSPGSTATLTTATGAAAGNPMLLQIHDAATGSVDALALYGAALTSAASLNLHFT